MDCLQSDSNGSQPQTTPQAISKETIVTTTPEELKEGESFQDKEIQDKGMIQTG